MMDPEPVSQLGPKCSTVESLARRILLTLGNLLKILGGQRRQARVDGELAEGKGEELIPVLPQVIVGLLDLFAQVAHRGRRRGGGSFGGHGLCDPPRKRRSRRLEGSEAVRSLPYEYLVPGYAYYLPYIPSLKISPLIRYVRELEKEGRVEKSNHIPRGMLEFWLDPDSPYFKEGKLDMNKEMVLFCAGGLRSALAAKTLKDMGFEKVSHIDGGFGAMKNSGFKVIK